MIEYPQCYKLSFESGDELPCYKFLQLLNYHAFKSKFSWKVWSESAPTVHKLDSKTTGQSGVILLFPSPRR